MKYFSLQILLFDWNPNSGCWTQSSKSLWLSRQISLWLKQSLSECQNYAWAGGKYIYLQKLSSNAFDQVPAPVPALLTPQEQIPDPWKPRHSRWCVVRPRELKDFVPSAGRGFQLSQFMHEPSPPPKAPIEPDIAVVHEPSPTPPSAHPNYFTTGPNEFGLYRIYQQRPSSIPDVFLDPKDVADAPAFYIKQDATPTAPKGLGESFRKFWAPALTLLHSKMNSTSAWPTGIWVVGKSHTPTRISSSMISCVLISSTRTTFHQLGVVKAYAKLLMTWNPPPVFHSHLLTGGQNTALLSCFLAASFRTILKLTHRQPPSVEYGFVIPSSCWNRLSRICLSFPPTWKDFTRCGNPPRISQLSTSIVRLTRLIFTGTWRLSWLPSLRREQTRLLLR